MLKRLARLLLAPRAAWSAIRDEDPGAATVMLRWAVPLALVPFAVLLMRFALVAGIVGARAGAALAPWILADAAARYVFILVWMWAVALVATWLAPRFESARRTRRAYAAVAYACAPGLLSSPLLALPMGQWLVVAGLLWSAALLRLGLPRLMDTPDRRATPYTLAVLLAAILMALLALGLPSCTQRFAPQAGSGAVLAPAAGAGKVPGGRGAGTRSPDERLEGDDRKGTGTLDLGDLTGESVKEMVDRLADKDRMREIERLSREAAETAGKIPFKPAEPSMLGELMPAAACGLARESLESTLSRLPLGELAQARALFGAPGGPVRVSMEIGDGSPRAAGMAQVRKLMPDREVSTPRGFQRFKTDGDYYIDSRWDIPRKEASFAVLIAGRFVVGVRAMGVESPECAEQAARAVKWEALAAFASAPVR